MPTGADVIRSGRKYLGVPYVSGTPDPCTRQKMDCDCFTKRTFNDLGIRLGWWTNQKNYGRRGSLGHRGAGDHLFFRQGRSSTLRVTTEKSARASSSTCAASTPHGG